MIDLRAITFAYEDATILDQVELSLEEGEFLLVSGRTGVGKSTLLGVLTGLVPRYSGGRLSGDVLLDGASIIDTPPRERAHLIGYVGQDPTAGFVTDTVEEELAYGMEQLGEVPATMRRRVEETLDLLGIADLRSRDLRTLSGGQQQRVAIGSVLTSHPRILVLDEPTSALDPTAAEDVLATLARLVQDLGMTVVLAEHRLERVIPFADRMCLFTGDGGVEVGQPADVLAHSPVVPPIIELGRALAWSPLPLTVRDARRRARPLVDDLGAGPTDPPPSESTELLVAQGIRVQHGSRLAVHDVDLTLASGRVTALMGRNGAGKSSLIWALQGSGVRRGGSLIVSGKDPAEQDAPARRALVGLVPQGAADLLYLETVADECRAADPEEDPGACRRILDELVPDISDESHPRDLSEGQRLALVLAIVLADLPPVLLLDEPTRGLDYPAKQTLARILDQLVADGRTVLVATHDVEFAAQVAHEVVVMAEGEVVSSGPVRRVVAESPSFAPQVTKILGAPWLVVDEIVERLRP